MKTFFKSFYITLVIIICVLFGVFTVNRIYEAQQSTKYGEYKKAVEFKEDGIRFFDFDIKKRR